MNWPALILLLMQQSAPEGCGTTEIPPLFECDNVLKFELEVPLKTLHGKASRKPKLVGELRVADSAGQIKTLDVEVTTRGRHRLDICSFPPLSLRLDPLQVAETVFAGQERLKIVTQCKHDKKYLQYLVQEYGIYKAFNQLTDISFRVRMLEITFRDSAGKSRDNVQVAFFIESLDEVARRTQLEVIEQSRIDPTQVDARHANIYEVFQFLIANTDWSMLYGDGDEPCCHNGKVLMKPSQKSKFFVLPYDFDHAGLIDTPYAEPDERLGIRSVRQRLYRGRCQRLQNLEATAALFNVKRELIEAALASGGLADKTLAKQDAYVARFYEIINDPRGREEQIVGKCRGNR
jgi:hypothetical protein